MKSFIFLKVYIFEELLILNAKKMGKRKQEDDNFLRKKWKKNKTVLPL